MADEIYVAHFPFEASHPKALAMYCSDGRFTDAVEELLHSLGHKRLDTLTMPGGPALLNMRSAAFSDVDAVSRAASFLMRSHSTQHVVLLAHEQCGYYRARYPADRPEQIRARQFEDLRESARSVVRMRSSLTIRLYFARPEGAKIEFHPVPFDGKG